MKNVLFGFLLVLGMSFLVVADAPKEQVPQAKDYQQALVILDNVAANIVLIHTPRGERGLTRTDVDELRRCTLLLQAALKELETLKNPPPAEPAAEAPVEAPK